MEHGRLAILLAVLALNRSFLSLFGSERLTKGCGHAILANLRLVYSGCRRVVTRVCCCPLGYFDYRPGFCVLFDDALEWVSRAEAQIFQTF
jgi:hypothetical protein